MVDHGFGAIPSPPDPRDFPISAAYAALGKVPTEAAALPASLATTPIPPITDQGTTPQCTAHALGGLKSYQDRIDQGKFFDFDKPLFFQRCGGNANGAVLRNCFDQALKIGYPLVGNAPEAKNHKIASYYAIPLDTTSIKQAILTFGEVVFGVHWQNSWLSPRANGVLPPPDRAVGGHAIRCRGWDDAKGFRLDNSWGPAWGVGGECYMPYSYLRYVFEIWKSIDVIETPPGGKMDPKITIPDMTCACKAGGTLYKDLASTQVGAANWVGVPSAGTYGTAKRADGKVMRSLRIDLLGDGVISECWYGDDLCTPNTAVDKKHLVTMTADDGQKVSITV
jgi:hypothetical protein